MFNLHKHTRIGGSGGMQIASETILGQTEHSHTSYLARGVLHPILVVHVCTY